jgi:hypothetical protein
MRGAGEGHQIIVLILEREEVIGMMKHLGMWLIEYPKTSAADARALPFAGQLSENFPFPLYS